MENNSKITPPRISSISRPIKTSSVLFKDARRQKIAEELKIIFERQDKIALARLLAKYNVKFIWEITCRLSYDLSSYGPLLAFLAEAAKPEILKIAGIADKRAREINAAIARLQTSLESKKLQPVQVLTGARPARKPDTFERSSLGKPDPRTLRKK